MSRTLAVALLLVVLGAAPASAQDDPVFTVTAPSGVYSATAADIRHWLRIVGDDDATARRQIFQLLVQAAWIRAEAAERGIVISDEAVADEFRAQRDSAFPTRRAFRRFLRESRQTVADILWRLRLDLHSDAIREQVLSTVTVNDEVVEAERVKRGNRRIPERRVVRLLLTRSRPAAVSARRELLAGASWRAVTRRYSIDAASRRRAGRMPAMTRRMFEPRLARPVFRARPDRIIGPVRTRSGYYVLRVTRVRPARKLSAAHTRRLIHAELLADAQQEALRQFVAAFDEKWRARTSCAPAYASQPVCA